MGELKREVAVSLEDICKTNKHFQLEIDIDLDLKDFQSNGGFEGQSVDNAAEVCMVGLRREVAACMERISINFSRLHPVGR